MFRKNSRKPNFGATAKALHGQRRTQKRHSPSTRQVSEFVVETKSDMCEFYSYFFYIKFFQIRHIITLTFLLKKKPKKKEPSTLIWIPDCTFDLNLVAIKD